MNKEKKCIAIMTVIMAFMFVSNSTVAINLENSSKKQIKTENNIGTCETKSFSFDFFGDLWHRGDQDNDWDVETNKGSHEKDGDTGSEYYGWTQNSDYTGLFSGIVIKEELDDDTYTETGAWCSCACEWGPGMPGGSETIKGDATLFSPPFKISNFNNIAVQRRDFEITSASLYFDYKIGSKDFDNTDDNEYVKISEIKLIESDGNGDEWDIMGDNLKWTPKSLGKPNGGWKGKSKNNYKASSSNLKNVLNDNLDSKFKLAIKLDCKLVAGFNCREKFKFWLDDLKIKGEYYFDETENLKPKMDVRSYPFEAGKGNPVYFKATARDPDDDQCSLHVEIWKKGDENNKRSKNSAFSEDWREKSVSFTMDKNTYPTGTIVKFDMWVEDDPDDGELSKESNHFKDQFKIVKGGKSKSNGLFDIFRTNSFNLFKNLFIFK